jgi:hypothetical protein
MTLDARNSIGSNLEGILMNEGYPIAYVHIAKPSQLRCLPEVQQIMMLASFLTRSLFVLYKVAFCGK